VYTTAFHKTKKCGHLIFFAPRFQSRVSGIIFVKYFNGAFESKQIPMGVGRGPWPPLDFHTWYKYSRGLKVLLFGVFLLFLGLFSRCPLKEA